MASITIRSLEPELKERLRVRAARHGRSMEDEARVILRAAVARPDPVATRLGSAIHAHFKELGGVDLELPPRETGRPPPKLK